MFFDLINLTIETMFKIIFQIAKKFANVLKENYLFETFDVIKMFVIMN